MYPRAPLGTMATIERQIHGLVTMSRVLDEARTAVALCRAVLKEALGRR